MQLGSGFPWLFRFGQRDPTVWDSLTLSIILETLSLCEYTNATLQRASRVEQSNRVASLQSEEGEWNVCSILNTGILIVFFDARFSFNQEMKHKEIRLAS